MITIDDDIADLVAPFAARRVQDLETIARAADEGDFDTVRRIGHRIKGSAGGFGFARMGELGGEIERASEQGDADAIRRFRDELEAHLGELRVRVEGVEHAVLDL